MGSILVVINICHPEAFGCGTPLDEQTIYDLISIHCSRLECAVIVTALAFIIIDFWAPVE
jgi:hypothetical protein